MEVIETPKLSTECFSFVTSWCGGWWDILLDITGGAQSLHHVRAGCSPVWGTLQGRGSHCPKVWSTNCSLQSARTLWGSSNSYLRTARLFICPTGQCPTPPSRVDIKLTKFKIKECRTQVFSLTCTDMIIVHCWSTVLCSRVEVSVGSSDLALRKPVWQFLYCPGSRVGLGLGDKSVCANFLFRAQTTVIELGTRRRK